MQKKYSLFILLISIVQLYGCASIVSGQTQLISVSAPNCPDADCKLVNDDGTYYVKTPGTVSVEREYDDLTITCQKEGYESSMIKVSSTTKGMAFGNILLGGGIGAGVDMATGAAYDYPSEIISPLDCRSKSQIASAPKSGNYDQKALALVNLSRCAAPTFVLLDGKEEIYRSQCLDGTVGVISCSNGECRPVNVSAPADQDLVSQLPSYSAEAKYIGIANGCSESLTATDITKTGETWMAKCSSGEFMVIECKDGKCTKRM